MFNQGKNMKHLIYILSLVVLSAVALADTKQNSSTTVTVQNPIAAAVKTSDNVMSYDFGKASFGWLEIDAPAGSYTVRLGEKIKGDKKQQEHIGYYNTSEEAFQAYKKAKEDYIKQVAQEEYNDGNITKPCYEAMMKYKVEITD
jgi:hypothetical protein